MNLSGFLEVCVVCDLGDVLICVIYNYCEVIVCGYVFVYEDDVFDGFDKLCCI